MTRVGIRAAKTNLSKLIARAQAGEEIVICKGKAPVARLTPITHSRTKRRFGAYRGLATVTPEFFEPLHETELRSWEGAGAPRR